jgi:hypothetical protein
MARDKISGAAIAIVKEGKKQDQILEIKKVIQADHIKSFQVAQEQMYCSATPFHIKQLNHANVRMTIFTSFATFFLGTAITLGIGALEVDIPAKPWIPYLLFGLTGFSLALTAGSWVFARYLHREAVEISDEILETANPRSKPISTK